MDKVKLQKLSIKNSASQRLTSIKLPRDLSLGGTKLHKKLYKPNLNVVRKKSNTEHKLKDIDKPKHKHQKVRDKLKQKFIQSPGVFSEGIVSNHVPTIISTLKVRQETTEKHIPVITKLEKVTECNKKQEESVQDIKQYLQDDGSDLEEKFGFSAIKWNEALFKKVKSEIEPDLFSVKEYFKHDSIKPIFYLWQLPDSFNFKMDENIDDFALKNMAEGIVGKICIRKSGKINVLIGKFSYELESSHWECFNEHLMSINIDKISQACVLGQLKQRFILSPDWNNLL